MDATKWKNTREICWKLFILFIFDIKMYIVYVYSYDQLSLCVTRLHGRQAVRTLIKMLLYTDVVLNCFLINYLLESVIKTNVSS